MKESTNKIIKCNKYKIVNFYKLMYQMIWNSKRPNLEQKAAQNAWAHNFRYRSKTKRYLISNKYNQAISSCFGNKNMKWWATIRYCCLDNYLKTVHTCAPIGTGKNPWTELSNVTTTELLLFIRRRTFWRTTVCIKGYGTRRDRIWSRKQITMHEFKTSCIRSNRYLLSLKIQPSYLNTSW